MKKQKRTLLTLVGTLIVVSMVLGTVPVFAANTNTGYLVTDFSAASIEDNIEVAEPYTKNNTVFANNNGVKVYLTAECTNGSVTVGASETMSIWGRTVDNESGKYKTRLYMLDGDYATRTGIVMCKFNFDPTRIDDNMYADLIFGGHYTSDSTNKEGKICTLRVYNDRVEALNNSNEIIKTFIYSEYFRNEKWHELAFMFNNGNQQLFAYIDGILFLGGTGSEVVKSFNTSVKKFKYANIQCVNSFSGNLFIDDIYFVFGNTYANINVTAPTIVRVGDKLTAEVTERNSSGAIGGKTFVWRADGTVIATGGNSLNIKGRYNGKNITVETCGYDTAGMYGMKGTSAGTMVEYTGTVSLATGKDSNEQPTVTANIALSDFFAEEGNSDKSFIYLLAAYDGKELVDCAVSGQITRDDASATLTVTGADSTEDVKLFVLNSMGTLVPVENVFTW